MKSNYEAGGYGYGHAKKALFELILARFATERTRYNFYMENLPEIDTALQIGRVKATAVANSVLQRVRERLGY
jgi:tryptophanyl-tRNA synthetase